MNYDSIVMAAVADELNRRLANGRVDEVHQPAELDCVITIRAGGANHMLLISADADSPRVYLTSAKRPNPQIPPSFTMLMRKHLKGARFVNALQIDFDRILHLNFSAHNDEPLKLIVEIMGKHSGAMLVNSDNKIICTIKSVGKSKSRYREVLPGKEYVAPPTQGKRNPANINRDKANALLAESPADENEMSKWLTKTFTGISPFFGCELAVRCGGDPARLPDVFHDAFDAVKQGAFKPVFITDDHGQTLGFYAFPTVQQPSANQHERPSISAVADMFYTSALPKAAFAEAKEDLIRRLRKELESRTEMMAQIEKKIAECAKAERFKQIGELILSQTAAIPPKAESVELTDYYDPEGGSVTIALDYTLSAAENAKAYFRKYQKALTGAVAMRERLVEIEAEKQKLSDALAAAESVTSREQVDELTQSLGKSGLKMRKQEESSAEKKKGPEWEGFRIQRVDANGWEILIGLNSTSNDYLLTRVAKPSDLWFHVKAASSSHVLIRTNAKPDAVPRQVLERAAELAAKHSDQKHSSLVPVDYTQRRYVRKPRGAAPGKALYQNEKTIYITPSP